MTSITEDLARRIDELIGLAVAELAIQRRLILDNDARIRALRTYGDGDLPPLRVATLRALQAPPLPARGKDQGHDSGGKT